MSNVALRRSDLLYPELSYKIIGVLYSVHNELGPGHHERYYQRAVSQALKHIGLPFREQVNFPMKFQGVSIGRYQLDFLIDGKIGFRN